MKTATDSFDYAGARQYCSTMIDHPKLGILKWIENQRTGIIHACRFESPFSVCGKPVANLSGSEITNGPIPGFRRAPMICNVCARALYRVAT